MDKDKEVRVEKLVRDNINLMTVKNPILALPLLQCRLIVSDIEPWFVAGIDVLNKKLIVSPLLARYKSKEIYAILAHEALHVITGTFTRRRSRDPFLWNIASDLEINWMLEDMGFTLPRDALCNQEYKHVYAEKIYEEIQRYLRKVSENVAVDADGNIRMGVKDEKGENKKARIGEREIKEGVEGAEVVHVDGDGTITVLNEKGDITAQGKIRDVYVGPKNQQEASRLRQEEKGMAVSAKQMMERGIGNIPKGLLRIIDRLTESRISWREILEDYITGVMERNDYSYRRPNKRYIMHDFYVPVLYGERKDVVVIVDTSGSISNETLRSFLSEVNAIVSMYNTTYIACDCEVQTILENVEDIDKVIRSTRGGGGTSFYPAFKLIEEQLQDIQEAHVILMTDGLNDEPYPIKKPSKVRSIVVLTTGVAPEKIDYDLLLELKEDDG